MASVKGKINFNVKHLTKGDPLPPFNSKLRLYSCRYCPFAHRVILALNAKEIDYEIVNVTLDEKPAWLSIKSPFAKVPVLEIEDGVTINESTAIVEYLDEVYPQRPLLSKDPLKKALDKAIVEGFLFVHELVLKLIKAPKTATDDLVAYYFRALDLAQNELDRRGTPYINGKDPGYVDYMIWPWFERIPTFDDPRLELDAWNYKLLFPYIKRMSEDPIVVEYSLSSENYKIFHASFVHGKKPPYNQLTQD